jgi:AraC-like DNA-binding protein/cytochrome c551/c552
MHAQQYRVKSEKRPACKASDKPAPKSRLAQILRKVESGSLRTVGELSLEFNLSPAYIQRIFKQQTGVRLGAVLAEQRLAKAAGLPANCKLNPTPEDATNMAATQTVGVPSDAVAFAMFMRLLAPPTPSSTVPGGASSISNGRNVFSLVGCTLCHTPTLTTGPSKLTPGLSNVSANLYSDLLVHNMGTGLADGVSQGGAGNARFDRRVGFLAAGKLGETRGKLGDRRDVFSDLGNSGTDGTFSRI